MVIHMGWGMFQEVRHAIVFARNTSRGLSATAEFFVRCHGPRRLKKSGVKHTPTASAGARAYNGGLGRIPQRGSRGQSPRWGVRGPNPPAADKVFVFKTVIFNDFATVLREMMYCLSCFFCKVSK